MRGCNSITKKAGEKWLFKYSLSFLIMCVLMCSQHILYHKSFIGLNDDTIWQHYNNLVYYGRWLRSLLHNFFVEHIWSIQTFGYDLGLGRDVPVSLNYDALGEPLNCLAVFFTPENTELLYNLIVLARMYIAGIAFYKYCVYQGYSIASVLPGALIYVFSFYTVELASDHTYFLTPLIYFPIILLGIDKIFKEHKPALFIVSCAVAAVDSFYFFYMLTIFMFMYGVMKYVHYFRREFSVLDMVKQLFSFIGYYILAVMMAAPIFMPSAYKILSSSRVGSSANVPGLYDLLYYVRLPLAFVNASADHYAHLGYGIIGVIAVVLLFTTHWKEKLCLKITFLLACVFLTFPFFGHVLNGFGYATNRWIWAFCFVVAIITVEMTPRIEYLLENGIKIKDFNVSIRYAMAIFTGIMIIPVLLFRNMGHLDLHTLFINLVTIIISLLCVIMLLWLCRRLICNAQTSLLIIIALNIFLMTYCWYAPTGGGYIDHMSDYGQAWNNLADSPFAVTSMVDGELLNDVRVDTINIGEKLNSAIQYGVNSVGYYNSMVDASTNEMSVALRLPFSTEHSMTDLNSRAMLLSAMGVKYGIVRTGDESSLPYGYNEKVAEKEGYSLYTTPYALPLTYWYDSIVAEADYSKLSALEKQQSMLQTAAVDRSKTAEKLGIPLMQINDLKFDDNELVYEIIDSQNVEFSEDEIRASGSGAYIDLNVISNNDTELYFGFEGLFLEGVDYGTVTISDAENARTMRIDSSSSTVYAGKHDFLYNFGYSHKHESRYRIMFNSSGNYTCENIRIFEQPVKSMEDWVNMRKAVQVDYSLGEDTIHLSLSPEQSGLLYIAVPYSIGWEAYANGHKCEIVKINNFGMGIYLNAGEHNVKFEYHTPFMKVGYVFCLAGMIGFALVLYCRKKQKF